jgi:hypothetical protein
MGAGNYLIIKGKGSDMKRFGESGSFRTASILLACRKDGGGTYSAIIKTLFTLALIIAPGMLTGCDGGGGTKGATSASSNEKVCASTQDGNTLASNQTYWVEQLFAHFNTFDAQRTEAATAASTSNTASFETGKTGMIQGLADVTNASEQIDTCESFLVANGTVSRSLPEAGGGTHLSSDTLKAQRIIRAWAAKATNAIKSGALSTASTLLSNLSELQAKGGNIQCRPSSESGSVWYKRASNVNGSGMHEIQTNTTVAGIRGRANNLEEFANPCAFCLISEVSAEGYQIYPGDWTATSYQSGYARGETSFNASAGQTITVSYPNTSNTIPSTVNPSTPAPTPTPTGSCTPPGVYVEASGSCWWPPAPPPVIPPGTATTIQGQVKYSSTPVAGVTVGVCAHPAPWTGCNAYGSAVTDVNGNYKIATSAGLSLLFTDAYVKWDISLDGGSLVGYFEWSTSGWTFFMPTSTFTANVQLRKSSTAVVVGDHLAANLVITVTPPVEAATCTMSVESIPHAPVVSSGVIPVAGGTAVWTLPVPVAGMVIGTNYFFGSTACYDANGVMVSPSMLYQLTY